MDHDFDPRGGCCIQELQELVDIEVVRCGDPERPSVFEELDRQRVGCIEREIRHEGDAVIRAKPNPARVAHQQAVSALLCEMAKASGEPGNVLDDRLTIACGEGSIRILELQRAGKQPMKAEEFLRGTPLKPPARLT